MLLFLSGLASGSRPDGAARGRSHRGIHTEPAGTDRRTGTPADSGLALERRSLEAIATDGRLVRSRNKLAENGFSFFGDLTQYYQGVTTGGRRSAPAYGGRGDYLMIQLRENGTVGRRATRSPRGNALGQDTNEIDGTVALRTLRWIFRG